MAVSEQLRKGFQRYRRTIWLPEPDGYAKQGLCHLVPNGACPYGNWTKAPGNVSFRDSHQIKFIGDAFVHLGAAGLDLGDGSQSDLVQGCTFTDISGNGLELGGVDKPLAPPEEFTTGNQILNNHIYSIGAEFRGGIGIVVGYARNTRIEHNQLDHLPYAGMSIGWGGWPDKIKQAGQENYSEGNIIAHNLIFDYMLVLADGGAIYTQGLTGKSLKDGEQVMGNVVRDQFSTGHGIYTDNGSCNITVANNIIFNTNFDNWGSRHKDYYDGQDGKNFDPLAIENNYWQQGGRDTSQGNVIEEGNHLIDALSQAPKEILDSAGLEPQYRHILNDRFGRTSAPEPPSRVAAAAGNGAAYVTWSPSVFEGGEPVRSYTVTASNGAQASISAADFLTNAYVEIPNLTNGNEYTFTVVATNSTGVTVPSLPSLPISVSNAPAATPAAPANAFALPGVGMASIHFQAPPQNRDREGADPIIAYAVTVNPGGRKVIFKGRRVLVLEGRHTTFDVVDNLKKGETYTFSVAAVTPGGEGAGTATKPVTIQQ